jgi:hypothetical protein
MIRVSELAGFFAGVSLLLFTLLAAQAYIHEHPANAASIYEIE